MSPKKVDPLDALLNAQKAGVEIPPELFYVGMEKKFLQEGTAEVWRCPKCKGDYMSPIRILEAECECGGTMKKVWSAPYLNS